MYINYILYLKDEIEKNKKNVLVYINPLQQVFNIHLK